FVQFSSNLEWKPEKEDLMRHAGGGGVIGSFYVNPSSTVLNNSGIACLETDLLLRERTAPLASVDSLGRCSTPSSVCTSGSKTASSTRSSRASSSTVALNPDYLAKDPDYLTKNPEFLTREQKHIAPSDPAIHLHKESSV
ncbi:hypothetical protein OTU49_016399, partial [Cherax quadricarinatus]